MNFANLLDLSALAVPSTLRADGLPFGITLFAPRDADARLSALGNAFQRSVAGRLGATNAALPKAPSAAAQHPGNLRLAVVGAHLSGQPLNKQLCDVSALLLRSCKTAPEYRLYALSNTVPPKPGLVRVREGGSAIEVEFGS